MMEKNVALKYWREAISTVVYTLNRVQVKKGTNATPFELWYGHLLMSNISKYLDVNAIYIKSLGMESLMQKVRKEYFLVILLEAKLISA